MSDPELDGLIYNFRLLEERTRKEEEQRSKVIASPEFQRQMHIAEMAQQAMDEMEKGIGDSRTARDAMAKVICEKLRAKNMTALPGFIVKTRNRKTVNVGGVLKAVGGDLDMFSSIVTITQEGLKRFAKDNPDLSFDLLDCIESAGTEAFSVELEPTPQA